MADEFDPSGTVAPAPPTMPVAPEGLGPSTSNEDTAAEAAEDGDKPKRRRRSREERKADLQAQIAALDAPRLSPQRTKLRNARRLLEEAHAEFERAGEAAQIEDVEDDDQPQELAQAAMDAIDACLAYGEEFFGPEPRQVGRPRKTDGDAGDES